jgi:hypothetical protein
MINEALREARLNRLCAFLRDCELFMDAKTKGRTMKSRVSKLQNYSLSITAAKSDEAIRPLAEHCEKVLALLTDGKEFTDEKLKTLSDLYGDIIRMVSDNGV